MFDNDGTLWCEKPMPIQLDFILRRLVEMAEADPTLRERQPWKAAYERDYGWFAQGHGRALRGRRHERADARGGILAALRRDQRRGLRGAGRRVPAQRAASDARSRLPRVRLRPDGRAARLPGRERVRELHRLGRRSRLHAADQPGGVRHPARARDRQRDGARLHQRRARRHDHPQAAPDYLDDGPEKPIRIWSRTGRRPLLAAGNSNGDIPMLDFTQHADKPSLRLLVLHDDAEREFAYIDGAEQALERAAATAGRSSASRTTGPPSSDGDAYATRASSVAPRPSTASSASTTAGSRCAPALRRSSMAAPAGVRAFE